METDTLTKKLLDIFKTHEDFKKIIKIEINKNDSTAFSYMSGNVKAKVFTLNNDGTEEILPILVKYSATDKEFRKRFKIAGKFKNESKFYCSLLPEIAKRIEMPELLEVFPKHYLSSTENLNEMIVLEDLSVKGFRSHSNPLEMDLKSFQLSFRNIAKVHAAGFVFKWKEPERFKELASKFSYGNYTRNKSFDAFIGLALWDRGVKGLNKAGIPLSESFVTQLENNLVDIEKMIEMHEKWISISHGDFLVNNVMFSENEAKIVDLQLMCFSSIGFDLASIIYISSNKTFRDKHLLSLLKEYHDELLENIIRLTPFTKEYLEEEKGLHFDAFVWEFKFCLPIVYRICSFFLGIMWDPDHTKNLKKDKIIQKDVFLKICWECGGDKIDYALGEILKEIEESKVLDSVSEHF